MDGEGVGHLVHSQHLLASVLIDELAEQGWNVKRAAPLYCVSGAFTNPITAAAHVATQLGQLDRPL
jgi:hypothetical protein